MILVTGGTGLVGAHLLLQLLHGNEAVRAIYRSSSSIEKTKNLFETESRTDLFAKIEWVQADITDIPALEKAFENIEQVYHCAALISFDSKDEEQLRKINIEGTANVVNCCIDFNVKKLCHVSSIAALGDAREGEKTITEETEWNPEKNHGDYALTKYGAETEVWRGSQEGLDVVVVNPGVIFGKGFGNAGSGELLEKIHDGFPFYTKGSTGITAVEDVTNIMIQLMKTDISGERFTIVSENIILQNLLNNIADNMQKKRPYIYARPFMTSIYWRMDWLFSKVFLKKRSFTKATAKSSHSTEIYDNSKIINQLKYSFQPMKSYLTTVCAAYLPR
ncbi:nucleoside-diphosphate-sugar epimerase [Flavobacterium enshiense DK69]|uniref:NAD-dependent epimerase n=1 Tax=Flavobacterium enshiense DK69 TaxID=1107311 RepID=V6SCR2_9FLAO|nr:NAD-dependent epimerase/dehydratase family protein [Flavobacterium enshiense]ESU24473.1 nucleoside-diphosphate-sugar epimerase [Flavobacterium enshiense DK69]KGO93870.1 NAD-dependent epimerase [Flavobacterium enshiense DK69]